jgi:DNA polymerase-3 subunit epsilon
LCKRYRVDNSHRSLHGALLDANLLAHVYLAMTGGQKSLFGEESRNTQEKLGNEFLQIERQVIEGLLVIQANEEEIKQHDSRLMELQDGAK